MIDIQYTQKETISSNILQLMFHKIFLKNPKNKNTALSMLNENKATPIPVHAEQSLSLE